MQAYWWHSSSETFGENYTSSAVIEKTHTVTSVTNMGNRDYFFNRRFKKWRKN